MIIIVDGYNVLKQIVGNKLISSRERKHYVSLLERYSRKKHHTIIVVFDGGEHILPYKETDGMVSVVYAGAQMNADTWIMRHIRTLNPSAVVLVSSDRTLVGEAEEYHITSIDSRDFHTIVQESCTPPHTTHTQSSGNPAVKLHPHETSQAEDLMQNAAAALNMIPIQKKNSSDITVPFCSKKIKKQDKLLLKKLRAL